MWDEYDPLALDLLESRPNDEPVAESFRLVVRETLGGLYRRDPERLLQRVQLSMSIPEVRARFLEQMTTGVADLASLFARTRGTETDELRFRVVGASLLAAVIVAIEVWQRDDGKDDLLALLDQATDALAASMRELKPSS
jgi:AcrR family transcriptional regulator